jgi:hypothetical protein
MERVHHKTPHKTHTISSQHSSEQVEEKVVEQSFPSENHPLMDLASVETIFTWTAPIRHYRKRQRQYFFNIFFIVLALEIILVLFSQYLLMVVILSLAFLAYALATTPPGEVLYRISTEGLMIGDHFYLWQELYDFYFKERHHMTTLHVRTQSFLPGELVMLLGDASKEDIKQALLPFLPFREFVRPDLTERAGDWLSKTFPLDRHPSEFASK